MIKPTLHMNGSSSDTLLATYRKSVEALRLAIDALSAASPNGRDYYPQGDGAMRTATAEHTSRISRLVSVKQELEALWEHVTDEADARDAARRNRP